LPNLHIIHQKARRLASDCEVPLPGSREMPVGICHTPNASEQRTEKRELKGKTNEAI
jgi:hypothetical protein